ncbi:hypothetical protein [Yunchengibacter salinarum]|uniref:hypothetical protein n=1 Tax=Yunchengibacter salinarum TaxID=3133399 RepID=UPI0035B6818B
MPKSETPDIWQSGGPLLQPRVADFSAIEGESLLLPDDVAAPEQGFALGRTLASRVAALGRPLQVHDLTPAFFGSALLPHVTLLDVISGGEDFRWRIFGTAHRDEYGRDLTGCQLSELSASNPTLDSLWPIFQAGLKSDTPRYFQITYFAEGLVRKTARGAVCRALDAKGVPRRIVTVCDWE